MSHPILYNYGLSLYFEQKAALYPQLSLARVTRQHRDTYIVVTEKGEIHASVSGKFLHHINDNTLFPVVGDWVMVNITEDKEPYSVIQHVLQRKSVFERKAAGTQQTTQVVASNIDYIFICMSLNTDFNLRRLERYLAIAWQSTATPVIVLTKSDLCSDLSDKLTEIATVSFGADVVVTSILNANGQNQFSPYLNKEKTVVFLGSSGVGKSSLVNQLLGKNVLLTQKVGSDDSGRHTTTHRQLFVLPAGGVVIDTPGMRELQLDTGNLSKAFEDVAQRALQCKFRNCTHAGEDGCAVQQAIFDGKLSKGRLENFQKLKKEIQYEKLNSRQIEQTKINNMFGSMEQFKQKRRQIKNKNHRKH